MKVCKSTADELFEHVPLIIVRLHAGSCVLPSRHINILCLEKYKSIYVKWAGS